MFIVVYHILVSLSLSEVEIGGPIQYGTNLLALTSTLLVLLRNKALVPFMILPNIFSISPTPMQLKFDHN